MRKLRKRRRDERATAAAEQARQADEGERPFAGGLWAVDRILHVARLPRRGVKFLIRWKGDGDDEWRSLGDMAMENKEAVARRWVRTAFGVPRAAVASTAGTPRTPRLAASKVAQGERRYRKLRRWRERWHRGTLRCVRPGPEWPESLSEDAGGKRQRVLLDELEDLELRGEGWRAAVASAGRGVKKRTRGEAVPPRPTPQARKRSKSCATNPHVSAE